MNCIYCGTPDVPLGAWKCSDVAGCDYRALKADIEARISAAVAEEREACAMVAADLALKCTDDRAFGSCESIEHDIRARGAK